MPASLFKDDNLPEEPSAEVELEEDNVGNISVGNQTTQE